MARGLRSGASEGGNIYPGRFDLKEGTFYATLAGGFIYWNRDFNTKEPILQFGLTFHVEDDEATHQPIEGTKNLYEYTEHFLNLNVDDDGNFTPGGERARAYKLLSAAYGKSFNSFDEEFEWGFWGEWMDDIESIDDIPFREEFESGKPWPTFLTEIDIMGEEIVGNRVILTFAYPTNPQTKKPGKRIKAVDASPIPGGAGKKKSVKKLDKSSDDEAEPKHVTWVREALTGLGLKKMQHKGFLVWFSDGDFTSDMSLTEFGKEEATRLAGIIRNSPDTAESLVSEYQNEVAKPPAPERTDLDMTEEFPPEEDLPF